MKRARLSLLILMATLGLALIVAGTRMIAWREEQDKVEPPVDLPLPMSVNEFTVDTFTVPEDADYLIAISADRTLPRNTLDCMLGIDDPLLDKCEGIQKAVNATWAISTGGRQIASGSSATERVAGWSQRVFRGIGRFSGRRGQSYRLDMKFLSATSPLRSTKPRVRILLLPSNDPDEYGASMRYALAKPGGITFVIVGFLLLAFAALIGAGKARIRA